MSRRELTTQLVNERTRINRLTFHGADDKSGSHTHDFDYVVVPVTGGDLTVVADDGNAREFRPIPGVVHRQGRYAAQCHEGSVL
jgi:hypothetical protein